MTQRIGVLTVFNDFLKDAGFETKNAGFATKCENRQINRLYRLFTD